MRRVWRRVWNYLRELSGEAALERRMACQCATDPQKAYEAAVSEQFGAGSHRCC